MSGAAASAVRLLLRSSWYTPTATSTGLPSPRRASWLRSPAARVRLLAQACEAAFSGDEARLRQLIGQGLEPDGHEPHAGATPLWLACLGGHAACARLLIELGADTNAASNDGATPLAMCCINGHDACAALLLSARAEAERTTAQGYSPLFAAAHGGHSRLVTVWLAKADVNRATSDGTTCLMAAAQAGHAVVVKLLLAKQADPMAVNAKGQRALELASAGKRAEVLELLTPVTPGPPPPPPINAAATTFASSGKAAKKGR